MGTTKSFNTIIVPLGYAESQQTAVLVFTCKTHKFKDIKLAETSLALFLLSLLTYRCEMSLEDNSKECCEFETGKFCSKCGCLLQPEFKITANQFENFLSDMILTCCDSFPADTSWECPPSIDDWDPFLSYPIEGPPHVMGNDEILPGYPERILAKLAGLS